MMDRLRQFEVGLRSSLAAWRRDLFTVTSDGVSFPIGGDDHYYTLFLHYYAGWALHKLGRGAYDINMAYPDPLECVTYLDRHGLICPPSAQTSLEFATLPELKAFARVHGLAVRPCKKADMIRQILDSAPAFVLDVFAAGHRYLIPSEAGYRCLRALYDDRVTAELSVADALFTGRESAALQIAVYYYRTHPMYGKAEYSIQPAVLQTSVPRDSYVNCLVLAKSLMNSGHVAEYIKVFGPVFDPVSAAGLLTATVPDVRASIRQWEV